MKKSIIDAIGNTPLVEIRELNPNPKVKILAKLEYFNPGGSIKDRAALYMIEAGEKSGALTPNKTVIEATSGNTGIGLALVCSVKGYKILLTMSEAASMERQKILKARGAEILLTPAHRGTDGAIEEVYRLAREHPDAYFMADQYNNDANWRAHYFGTAEEIWRQTRGEVSTVVATMGTTGTLMGVSRRLKEYNQKIRIVGVEPYLGHKIQGLKNLKEAYLPGIFEKNRIDEKVNIDDEDAFGMTRLLARKEGLFVGMSSGAAMVIACREAEAMTDGVVVAIFPDGGERYLSTSLFTVKERVDLNLFNTLSRQKEPFEPIVPGKASIYSCGPAAHSRMHLGECRRFVFADLLCRYLEYREYSVNHIINITDLDDKTISGSEASGESLPEFARKHIEAFKKDLALLNVRPADKYPLTSDHVDDMVSLTSGLVKKGFAYEKLRSIYFDISRFADYGRLSGIDINKIKLGATVDLDDYEKDNPRDFTLLKRSKLSELKRGIYVKSEWGNVRPSWHLQCATIAMKYLGDSFDIHTSGRELVFPHHENEIAIATATSGKPPARYWLHCDQVRMAHGHEQEHRIKAGGGQAAETGNRLTLEHLTNHGFAGRVIRFWLLSTHYRKPLTFSPSGLENAGKSLNRLDACIGNLRRVKKGAPYPELDQLLYDIRQHFVSAMDDDLNISAGMVSIFKHVKRINTLIREERINPEDASKLIETFRGLDAVLKVMEFQEKPQDQKIEDLKRQRQKAREAKDWQRADQIREQLMSCGVVVRDEKLD